MGAEIRLGRDGLGVELDKRKEEVRIKVSWKSKVIRIQPPLVFQEVKEISKYTPAFTPSTCNALKSDLEWDSNKSVERFPALIFRCSVWNTAWFGYKIFMTTQKIYKDFI